MKTFNSFLGGGSRFESVRRIRLALRRSRLVIPDESDGSRGMTEASLKESATHDLVWSHKSSQGLGEDHISFNDVYDT